MIVLLEGFYEELDQSMVLEGGYKKFAQEDFEPQLDTTGHDSLFSIIHVLGKHSMRVSIKFNWAESNVV